MSAASAPKALPMSRSASNRSPRPRPCPRCGHEPPREPLRLARPAVRLDHDLHRRALVALPPRPVRLDKPLDTAAREPPARVGKHTLPLRRPRRDRGPRCRDPHPQRATAAVGVSENLYHHIAGIAGGITGIVCLAGFGILVFRRTKIRRIRVTTSLADVIVFSLLGLLIVVGDSATFGYNILGSGFDYRATVGPWFRSLWFDPHPSLSERAFPLSTARSTAVAALRDLAIQPARPRLELPAAKPRPSLHPLPTSIHASRALSSATRVLDAVPPSGGAAVMATRIVSIGLTLDERETLSRVLLGIGVALWLGLCAVFARRAIWSRARWIAEARSPAALTAVAGTAVLGSRLALLAVPVAAYALLAVALCLWAGLLGPVLRHWSTPTVGVSFVLTVATESLAVLAALLGARAGNRVARVHRTRTARARVARLCVRASPLRPTPARRRTRRSLGGRRGACDRHARLRARRGGDGGIALPERIPAGSRRRLARALGGHGLLATRRASRRNSARHGSFTTPAAGRPLPGRHVRGVQHRRWRRLRRRVSSRLSRLDLGRSRARALAPQDDPARRRDRRGGTRSASTRCQSPLPHGLGKAGPLSRLLSRVHRELMRAVLGPAARFGRTPGSEEWQEPRRFERAHRMMFAGLEHDGAFRCTHLEVSPSHVEATLPLQALPDDGASGGRGDPISSLASRSITAPRASGVEKRPTVGPAGRMAPFRFDIARMPWHCAHPGHVQPPRRTKQSHPALTWVRFSRCTSGSRR